ncbi:MAG: DUF1836 domain-containing protein [Clostridia bacterium]
MKSTIKEELTNSIRRFSLPRYDHLPDMGLYLEQTVTYINQCLEPLGCIGITGSMIRNYVKMGLVKNPCRKQYFKDQIGHLIVITILKPALSLEHIKKLFVLQEAAYPDEVAYDYFCAELENNLYFRFGLTDSVKAVGKSSSLEKEMLRSAVTSVSHIIYLDACFEWLAKNEES